MKKPFILDTDTGEFRVAVMHDEWRKNYKIKSQNNSGLFDRRAF